MSKNITKEEVLEAQTVWGNGVVAIGKAFTDKADYEKVATDHVDSLYAYGMTDVLFKPTKAAVEQFVILTGIPIRLSLCRSSS